MNRRPSRARILECCGIIIDVQDYFLEELTPERRSFILQGTLQLAQLWSDLKIPIIATLERPISSKGKLPEVFGSFSNIKILEKDFFDLGKEPHIREHLRALGRKQIILAGCETDVCVLQSCLGLLQAGYEVYVVEDFIFSSTSQVSSSIQRMRDSGAILLTYKSLFHELLEAQQESSHRTQLGQVRATDGT